MKTLPIDASDEEILEAIRQWVGLLIEERYKEAYDLLWIHPRVAQRVWLSVIVTSGEVASSKRLSFWKGGCMAKRGIKRSQHLRYNGAEKEVVCFSWGGKLHGRVRHWGATALVAI